MSDYAALAKRIHEAIIADYLSPESAHDTEGAIEAELREACPGAVILLPHKDTRESMMPYSVRDALENLRTLVRSEAGHIAYLDDECDAVEQAVQDVLARAVPPTGVMPSAELSEGDRVALARYRDVVWTEARKEFQAEVFTLRERIAYLEQEGDDLQEKLTEAFDSEVRTEVRAQSAEAALATLRAHLEGKLREAEDKLLGYSPNGTNARGRTYDGRTLSPQEQAEVDPLWSHWNGRCVALREAVLTALGVPPEGPP